MRVTIVVAIAENGVIGREGGLPWRLATDMKRFRETTMGKPVIMGRKTWEGLPKRPLPGRRNIVVTRDRGFRAEDADIAFSLEQALELARAGGAEEACVLGGGEIYAQALPLADQLDVTHVLAELDGDTRFPPIDPRAWRAATSESFPAGEKDSHPTRHVIYERSRAAQSG